jgi:hypothetical protein
VPDGAARRAASTPSRGSSTGRAMASIVVVSGLPRSGTSLMMKMLAAGGIEVLTDHRRAPDRDNPEGYFEFEQVKQLKDGNVSWLSQAKGKAVKVVSPLLEFLPSGFSYDVVFMRRCMAEIVASQRTMLVHRGQPAASHDDDDLVKLYEKHLDAVKASLARQPHCRWLEVDYNRLIDDPAEELERVARFLGNRLDVAAMGPAIDRTLYKHRL